MISDEAVQVAPKQLSLMLALTPVAALVIAVVGGVLAFGFTDALLFTAMLFAAAVAGVIGATRGKTWDDVQVATGRRIAEALPAILILLSIGGLLSAWMFSGTIPLMVVLGIDLINPQFMVLTAFLATALMSTISGTSWGAAATIGVALMGAAQAMGLPLAPVAGAIVSGAYFGDKLSPISDMSIVAALGAKADLYTHVRHMLDTSVPPTLIAIAAYVAAGFASSTVDGEAMTNALAVKGELDALFDLGIAPAIPLAIAIVGIAMRGSPTLVIVLSSICALIIGVLVQGFSVSAGLATFVSGFDIGAMNAAASPSDSVENLLNRGGVFSMAETMLFIVAAFLFAGALEVCGALETLLNAMLSMVRSAFGLIAATLAAGSVLVAMTSNGTVTSLIVGNLFRQSYADRGLAPENLSRAIEDSVAVLEPLMPWTVSALFMAGTLGVATVDYFPWAIFCFLGPIFSLIFAAAYELTGFGLKKIASPAPRNAA